MNEEFPVTTVRSSKKYGKVILAIVVLALLAGLLWWKFGTELVPLEKNNAYIDASGTPVEKIMYSATEGFIPKEATIKRGMTVTFLDQDGSGMWVASNDHPEHAGYAGTPQEEHCPDGSGLKFDQCAQGVSYSFTFQKAGTWGYHNHEHPEAMGTITVTE